MMSAAKTDMWAEYKEKIRDKYPEVRQLEIEEFVSSFMEESILVDVRAPEEYAVSHLAGAINIFEPKALSQFMKSVGDRDVVLYCSIGYRSSRFAHQLTHQGYERVWNLEGSIFEWANSGHPVVDEYGSTDVVHPFSRRWRKLLNKEYWSKWRPPDHELVPY